MPIYEVPVTRTVTESTVLEVEADSEEEAERTARKRMNYISMEECLV